MKREQKMKYVVREIEPRDNQAVEGVIRACLVEFGANHAGTAWADPDLGRFSEVYSQAGNKYWVAEDENGVERGDVIFFEDGFGYFIYFLALSEAEGVTCSGRGLDGGIDIFHFFHGDVAGVVHIRHQKKSADRLFHI